MSEYAPEQPRLQRHHCARVPPLHLLPVLTADDIARMTRTPLRTVQRRLAAWRDRGGPVVRLYAEGRGQPPWGVSVEDYCRRAAIDPATLGQ